jgi:hypothetical protein
MLAEEVRDGDKLITAGDSSRRKNVECSLTAPGLTIRTW